MKDNIQAIINLVTDIELLIKKGKIKLAQDMLGKLREEVIKL